VIYSVYTPSIRKYTYWLGDDIAPGSVPKTHPLLGTPADDATPSLPLFAKEIGTGDEAVGRIARPGVNFESLFKIALWVAAAYGVLCFLEGR
jgi:hypothetical protein